jgi:choline dehydrogenase-like flavoprotein
MFSEFQQVESHSELSADICIVGGGAAGIAIARELIDADCSVLLLESGGMSLDSEVQSLYEGTNTRDDFALNTTRFRFLGGTTNVWGGWCAPLDPIDFEKRDWVPDSGWPITFDDLSPFYDRAQQLCGLGAYRYEVEDWPSLAKASLALDPAKLEHKMWQISQLKAFGRAYEEQLRRATSLNVMLNATVTRIITDPGASRVVAVEVQDLHGRRATVRASTFVMACGGIEIPRLLLASNQIHPAGVGNRYDLVGRYFMEHPHPDAGGILLTGDPESLGAYGFREVAKERVVMAFGPSPAAQKRHRILNSSIAISGPLSHGPSEGWDSLIKISRARKDGKWPENFGSHIGKVLRDLGDVLREGYKRDDEGPIKGYQLTARTEVVPKRENRVTLGQERDALDVNRAELDWNVGTLDRTTVATTMILLAEEFGRLNVGRVRINELLLEEDTRWSEGLSWFGHHMGTTRMHADSRRGVVNADCRVHGISNLFIASSAVFPTCGFANPTLTIVALALRLADHLKSSMAAGA